MKLPAVLAFTVLGGAALALGPGCGPDDTCAYVCVQKPRDAGADAGSASATGSDVCGEIVDSPKDCPSACQAIQDCGFA